MLKINFPPQSTITNETIKYQYNVVEWQQSSYDRVESGVQVNRPTAWWRDHCFRHLDRNHPAIRTPLMQAYHQYVFMAIVYTRLYAFLQRCVTVFTVDHYV